jgi:hypothetical protein
MLRADVAWSSLRKIVFRDVVVQPRLPGEAMRSLRLAQIRKLNPPTKWNDSRIAAHHRNGLAQLLL